MGSFLLAQGKTTRLSVSACDDLAHAKQITRIVRNDHRPQDALYDCTPATRIPVSSVGLKLGKIAAGAAELHINNTSWTNKWDTCAPQVILEEAGGTVTDFFGNPLDYRQSSLQWKNSFVASNTLVHEKVLRAIKGYMETIGWEQPKYVGVQ